MACCLPFSTLFLSTEKVVLAYSSSSKQELKKKKPQIIIVANILNIYYVRSHGLITLHAFSDLIFYVVYHKNLPCWLFVMQISRPCPWRFQVNRSGVRCKTISLDSFKEGSTLNSAVFNTHARSF